MEDYVDSTAKTWGGPLRLKSGAVPSLCVPNTWAGNPMQYLFVPPGHQLNPLAFMSAQASTVSNVAMEPSNSSSLVRKENIMPGYIRIASEDGSSFHASPEAGISMPDLNRNKEVPAKKVPPNWRTCFLCGYRELGGAHSQTAFHKFPADESACKLWKQICNLTDLDDVSNLKLCSKHFHPEDYNNCRAKQQGGLLKLKPGTVPSIAVPNPLSSYGTPTKYFIVSNTSPQNHISNDVQPVGFLNATVPNHATDVALRSGNTGTNMISAPPREKEPTFLPTSAPKASPVTKRSSFHHLTPQHAFKIGLPRVVIKRLKMSDIDKYQKGLITDEQLTEDAKIKKEAAGIKPVTVGSKTAKNIGLNSKNNSIPDVKNGEENQKDANASVVKKVNRWRRCYLCKLGEGSDKRVSLHKFPADPEVCIEWMKACNLNEQDNVSPLRVCSRHFKPEEVRPKLLGGGVKLKAGAVPSVDVPNPSIDISKTLANIKTESMDEFDPSNLLEVVMNESSHTSSCVREDEETEVPTLGKTKVSVRSCFLCDFKEECGVQSTAMCGVTLHRFPNDKLVNRMWKQVCNLIEHDYVNTSSLFICSNHFVAEDYIIGGKPFSGIRVLKPGAVPSISVPNPLKTMSLSTLESIEPESLESSDDINPLDLMEATFDAPESPQIWKPVNVNFEMNSNINNASANNRDGSLMFQNISPSVLKRHHVGGLQPNQFLKVIRPSKVYGTKPGNPSTQGNSTGNVNVLIRELNPSRTSSLHTASASQPQALENVFLNQMQSTVDKIASQNKNRKPIFIGRPVDVNQTLKIVETGHTPGRSIQLMPPLKLSMAPPGLFLPKSVNVVDNSSQTPAPAQCVEQSCQTEVVNGTMDFVDQAMESDVASPPVTKKQCLSLSLLEASPSEDPTLKHIQKGPMMKKYSRSQLLEQRMRRIKKSINTLEDLLCHLQKRDLLSKDAADVLMSSVTHDCQELILKTLQIRGICKWSHELKTFALTLHAYSIDAYNYIRNLWPNLIPDVAVIKNWFSVENGRPGFTQEVLDAIYLQSKDKKEGILCNIVISEMPIQQEMLYENNHFFGGVDLGTDQDVQNDSVFEAQNVLIFFVTALDASWSAPVGYFLIRSLTAKERASLLVKCLNLLHDVCANVLSITLDGSPANTSMCRHLGANFSYGEGFQPWFLNPVTREKLFVFWDPCYMMKSIRDALGDRGVLLDSENKNIKWSYIRELSRIQIKQPWEVDTKLTEVHVNYQDNRADIKLCLQTLSRSVYKGFMSVLGKNIESFEGCYSTAVYCLMFNNIFDMLNCRNQFSKKKFRVPINDESIMSLRHSASVFIKYISSLKDSSGTPILNTCRRTGFLGLITCLINIFELYDLGKSLGLKYLLTRKLSVDHVRTFISAVQCRDNGAHLNAKQFESLYRKLILKCGMSFEGTGCLADAVHILCVSSQTENYMDPICDYKNRMTLERVDHYTFSTVLSLKPIIGDPIKYTSGFVVNKILSKKICVVCAEHLTEFEDIGLLLKKENQRKYVVPSKDVCRICKTAEIILQENRIFTDQHLHLKFLVTETFCRVGRLVFDTDKMKAHVLEQSIFDNHLVQLCNLVTEMYLNMRMFLKSAT